MTRFDQLVAGRTSDYCTTCLTPSRPAVYIDVTTVIALAHSLGSKVVAEGVETQSQLANLKLLKCDQIQGYYYSKPLTKEELPEFVLRRNSLQE